MKLHWKAFPTVPLLILFGFFLSLECFSAPSSDVTYEDIKAINATCKGLDSCELPKRENAHEHCNCGSSCSLLGTCCVDSKFRNNYVVPLKNVECAFNIYDKKHRYVPMISSCDPDMQSDETNRKLCNSTAEELNDPFLKIPVTDPVTGISYRNYYCFACNRNYGEEQPIPWNFKIQSGCIRKPFLTNNTIPPLRYDSYKKTWVMDYDDKMSIDVFLNTTIPEELKNVTPYCYNHHIVSECDSEWTDDDIEKKCLSYMALARIISSDGFSIKYYRNPHCAICNYESIDNLMCLVTEEIYGWKDWKTDILLVKLFSLQDKTTKCDDNMIYDHFSKKCRRIYKSRRRGGDRLIGG
ncbi:uncharacterized protein [Parasteatoda tepidariorum]|uniref:uncharacterized protein isoform X1 n=1 Tax=Parasteatoda tepidariorum TaxID=114398 RepID=UPI001C72799C|nr:uncharacterized protein LOC107455229 [Parasteatoda tepidariorum]